MYKIEVVYGTDSGERGFKRELSFERDSLVEIIECYAYEVRHLTEESVISWDDDADPFFVPGIGKIHSARLILKDGDQVIAEEAFDF